jgi:hypothetical protein
MNSGIRIDFSGHVIGIVVKYATVRSLRNSGTANRLAAWGDPAQHAISF